MNRVLPNLPLHANYARLRFFSSLGMLPVLFRAGDAPTNVDPAFIKKQLRPEAAAP
jgi:hypothetical protein